MAAKDEKVKVIYLRAKSTNTHPPHHGGAWKVAYADFITAMMMFFLVMWLVSNVSQEAKQGIASYFNQSLLNFKSGNLIAPQANAGGGSMVAAPMPGPSNENTSKKKGDEPTKKKEKDETAQSLKDPQQSNTTIENAAKNSEQEQKIQSPSENDAQTKRSAEEVDLTDETSHISQQQDFQAMADSVTKNMQATKEGKELFKQLKLTATEKSLQIEVVEKDKRPMFVSGQSALLDSTKKILNEVIKVLQKNDHPISILGHTDAKPYRDQNKKGTATKYSNWELSSDRANSARRYLEEAGHIKKERFTAIQGLANTKPYNVEDPYAAENRRISITIEKDKAAK